MGIRNYLIEGISGVGKTTAAEELQRRGYHVIHGDRELAYNGDPETGQALERPPRQSEAEAAAWGSRNWSWPVDRAKTLIADRSHPETFFCGASRNSRLFIDLFDAVFVLEVDLDTLKTRLTGRADDEYGGKPAERDVMVRLHATRETIPERAVSIDATQPVARLVDAILLRCAEVDAGGC
jgi:hypothetical protein